MKRDINEMLLLTHDAIRFGVVDSDYSRSGVIVRSREGNEEDGYFNYAETVSKQAFAEMLATDDEGYEKTKNAVDHFKGKDGKFKINVFEVFKTEVEVEAKDYEEACQKVRAMYDAYKIELTLDDFIKVIIN